MESLTKQREILFCSEQSSEELLGHAGSTFGLEKGRDQAKAAIFLLADVEGVLDLKYLSDSSVIITYDIRILTLDTILQALSSVGFELDNSIVSKIKNALYAYSEDTLRENLGIESSMLTRDIFVQGYRQRPHGCRDSRPRHWRRYL